MKKITLYLSILLPFVVKAQAPVSPVIRNTFQNYYEPSTHNNWVWNGSGIWWQAVDSVQLQRNLSKYQPLIPYVPVPPTRTITVAGVTQDLSQNRTYTLANLSNGIGIAGGTYNGSTARVLTVDTPVIASKAYVQGNFIKNILTPLTPQPGNANLTGMYTANYTQGGNTWLTNYAGNGTNYYYNGTLMGAFSAPNGANFDLYSNNLNIRTTGGTNLANVKSTGFSILTPFSLSNLGNIINVTSAKILARDNSNAVGLFTGTTLASFGITDAAPISGSANYINQGTTAVNQSFNLGTGTGTASNLRATAVSVGASGDSLLVKKSDNLIYKRPYADFLTPAQAAAIYAVLNGGNTFTGDQVVNKASGVNYYSVQAGTLGNFTGGNAAGYTGRAVSDLGGYYNPFIIQQYQAGTLAVFEINAGSNSGNYPMLFKAGSFNLGTIGNNIWNDNDLNRQKGLLNVFSTDGISAGQTDIFTGDLFAMPVGTQIRYCATSTTNAPTTAAGWVEQYYRDSNIRGLRYRDILGNIWINTTTAYPTWGAWVQVSTSSGSGVFALQSTAINTGYGINGGGDLSTTRNILADTTSTTGLVSKSNLSNALALYPRSTRNITTGYGINGGGNLTADRTLVADTTSATGLVSKSRLATNLTGYFKLNANNTASGNNAFTGNTTFGNTGTAMATVDVWQGNGFAIIGGADNGAATRTNNTQKNFRLGMPAYVNAQNPVTIFSLNSMVSANQLSFGGGTAAGQAVTNIGFNVSSTVNNGTGTVVFNLNSTGAQVTGVAQVSSLTGSQAVFTDGSKNLVSNAITGTGNVVMSSSPSVSNIALTGSTNTLATPGTYAGSPTGIPNNTSVAAAISSYGANLFNITASRTFTSADFAGGNNSVVDIYVDCTGGNVTVTLPAPNTLVGTSWYVTRIDGSANTVTVATPVSAIYGGTTLTTQYQSRQFMASGSSWYNH